MATRSKGPLAGFDWLRRGIGAGFRHPKPLFGGAAFLLLICLLPTLVTLPIQFHLQRTGTPPTPAYFIWLIAGSALLGLLIVPLYAGYLQLIDAAERGQPARARDIFKPYREGEALRLIAFGVVLMLIYFAALAIAITATGGGLASWYMQLLAAQANHQLPPPFPPNFGLTMALLTIIVLFMMGFYSISLGQVSLRRRGVFAAIGDGFSGALKNVLPLVVLAIASLVVWLLVTIALVIVILVLAVIARFVGAWLMLALIVPVYLALLLVVFAVMFGVIYYMWRDVCGGDAESGVAPAIAA